MTQLDARRKQVKRWLDEGVTQKEIGRRLGVTQGRVSAMKREIAHKLASKEKPGEFLSFRAWNIVYEFADPDDHVAVRAALPKILAAHPTARVSLREIGAWIARKSHEELSATGGEIK